MGNKVKILLVGPINGQVDVFVSKLKSLQASKAGPFDVCFCLGPFDGEKKAGPNEVQLQNLPLPVYFQQYPGFGIDKDAPETDGEAVKLGTNLYLLGNRHDNSASVYRIEPSRGSNALLVVSCPPGFRMDSEQGKQLQAKCSTSDYQGCDFLFTSEWPQGIEDVVQADVSNLSFDAAEASLICRPRYHVSTGDAGFHASPAYRLPKFSHQARFLSMAPVISGKTSKTNKYVHALGLEPIEDVGLGSDSAAALPCPFGDKNDHHSKSQSLPAFANISGPQSFSRFESGNKRRNRNGSNPDGDDEQAGSLEPPNDTICTLFLHGLHKDVTGELQSTSSTILQKTFARYGITEVRHPPSATSTYCFLEFPSQEKALSCLLDLNGQATIKGVTLTLKWATTNQNKRQRKDLPNRHYVTHEEAADSSSLYFHPPVDKGIELTQKADGMDKANPSDFVERLRKFLEATLEHSLNEGVEDEEDRVTAETEPALQVKVRVKDTFGFFEFASHAAATMALAALTTSTDGGTLVPPPPSDSDNKGGPPKPPPELIGTTLRWAKGGGEVGPGHKDDEIYKTLGLERKHFPADSRTDCWFCLASPTCEKHLITSVGDTCYTTMPKGPMHEGHVLIVPVVHSSEGALTTQSAGHEEVLEWKDRLVRHAADVYDMDLFVFERAIETKGGYHTHLQCVPIPRGISAQLQTTIRAYAQASGFDLRPVESDLGVSALLSPDDDYLYLEIVVGGSSSTIHRFLYKDSGASEARVPLQFGREVLASVLQKPDLAHWKSCVLSEEQETKMATKLRESLAKFA